MPRPKTDKTWVEKIRVIGVNNRKASAKWVWEKLKRDAKGSPDADDVPSDRTVGRLLKEARGLDPAKQQPYLFFSWPDAMKIAALPWEASRACLDLLQWWNTDGRVWAIRAGLTKDEKGWGRPTNDTAFWFWRLTQAAPDAPIGVRWTMARHFSGDLLRAWDRKLPTESWPGIEACLTYRPWASKENSDIYNRALCEGFIPPYPRFLPGQPVPFSEWEAPCGPGWPKPKQKEKLRGEKKNK